MPTVQKQLLLPYSAQQMYGLVEAVEDYPNFLPWCAGTQVQRLGATATSAQGAKIQVRANVLIDFKGLKSSFTTLNEQQFGEQIDLQLEQGPFSKLEGQWRFQALASDACKVFFKLDYEFASRMLGLAVTPIFDQIARGFVDAFVAEAERRFEGQQKVAG